MLSPHRRLKILLVCFAIVLLIISSIEAAQPDPVRIELDTSIYDVEWNRSETRIIVAGEEGTLMIL